MRLTLKKNETAQAELLETFGAPNLVTVKSEGEEIWTAACQRQASVATASSSSAFGTVILFSSCASMAGLEQSRRTMSLIIKFRQLNGAKRVSEFRSRASSV